jgi:hypothetical protein
MQHTFTANATAQSERAVRNVDESPGNCRAGEFPIIMAFGHKQLRPEKRLQSSTSALGHGGSRGSGTLEGLKPKFEWLRAGFPSGE